MYKGFKDVVLADETEHAKIYENPTENTYGCLTNEYLITRNADGDVLDKFKWTGSVYKPLFYKAFNSEAVGKIKPRNVHQELAFDMLIDKSSTVKMLLGGYGSGKTLCMVAAALNAIKAGQFERIIWCRNNIETKGSRPIGHLPGSANDKLLPFALPLADHLGGIDGLNYAINRGTIELQHLGFIRGRDIRNSIIMCSEAENLSKENVQLLLGRVGEGSNLWLDGDLKQVDAAEFVHSSGLAAAIDRLAGNPLFGYVHLEKTERSPTAALADLLD